MEWLLTILHYDFIPAFILGFSSNAILLFFILRRTPKNLQSFRTILLIASIADAYVLLIFFLCQMEYRTINDVGLLVLRGPAKYLSPLLQAIIYTLLTFTMTLEVLVLLLQTYCRYRILKTRNLPSSKELFYWFLVIMIMSFIQLPVMLFDPSHFAENYIDYNQWWPQESRHLVVMVYDSDDNLDLRLLGIYRSFSSIVAFILAVAVAALSVWTVRRKAFSVSNKTKELMSQFTNTLIIRMIMFMCIVVLPQLFMQISVYFSYDSSLVNIIAESLFTWFPALNCAFTLFFMKAYRDMLVDFISRLFCLPSSTQRSTSTVQSIT
ncbi:hypothetical protein M3Y95_01203400 [Aphelenchoides besseyi]|nr:hypothetical protein M3Y95_01203400 [Aphelenchoides besseyi]